jgi:hypothetical protein
MQTNEHEENQSVHSRRCWVGGQSETRWIANRSAGKVETIKPTNTSEDYYVYCYIDPRNLEIFYYGKGTEGR